MRIFKNRWFARFARRERISDHLLVEAVTRAEAGLIDADLGHGLVKQRLPRQGRGRSGGFRAIIVYRADDRAIFVFGFAKSDRENIDPDELVAFRELAHHVLGLDDRTLDDLVAAGEIVEMSDA